MAGQDRDMAIELALRLLGPGQPELVEADDQGRTDPEALGGGTSPLPFIAAAALVHGAAIVISAVAGRTDGARDIS